VTTTTDLQWLVQKIGGSRVKVESLLNGTEDPHFIDAMPHFVSKVAAADIFCLVGLELETGWAPGVLTRSGNKKVQKGGKGYCETGATVSALGIPVGQIDRTQGDVHPSGNPHYHLGPDAFLQGGKTVLQTLVRIDSASKSYYQNNFEKLKKELVGLKLKVAKILEPIKDQKYLEYHKEFTYFFKEFGLKNEGSIEAAPGVLPSAGRLARVSVQAANSKIALALAAKTSPKKITKKFVAMSKVPVARVPLSIVKRGKIKTYEDLLTHIAKSMVDSSGKNAKM
jgi:zinc/manganese transport system substrate-binding protein